MYKQVRNPIGTMEESMQRYNGTYAVHLGSKQFIVTQDPGFIDYVLRSNQRNYFKSEFQTRQLGQFLGKGLLTSNGDLWLRQRRLIQPGFHIEKIQRLYEIMQRTVNDFVEQIPEGNSVDVYPLMNRLAFDMVINTLFNVKVEEQVRNQLSRFILETQSFVIKDIRQPYKSWWFRISGEMDSNLAKAKGAREIIRGIINQRKASKETHDDLLNMLLEARYEDNGLPMEEEQLIDEILVLIIAGHETTANALSWSLYLLASHRDKLIQLRRESAGLDTKQRVAAEYVNAVVKESMRLYPPAWISDRVALNDDHYRNFSFPAGTIIVLFYYGLHRDVRYWENPTAFMPDRFLKSSLQKEQNKVFFPFGSGPRLCIGNNFAMAEMAICLSTLVEKFDLSTGDKPPSIVPLVTLKPDKILLSIKKTLPDSI